MCNLWWYNKQNASGLCIDTFKIESLMLSLWHCYLCMYNQQGSSGLVAIHNISQNQSVLVQGPVDIKVNYPGNLQNIQFTLSRLPMAALSLIRHPSNVNFFGGKVLFTHSSNRSQAMPLVIHTAFLHMIFSLSREHRPALKSQGHGMARTWQQQYSFLISTGVWSEVWRFISV